MPTIEPESGIVTHINVFTVPRDKQDELVESLIDTVTRGKSPAGSPPASIAATTGPRS